MVQGGDNITKSYSVPANSRYTVNYNRDIGPDKSVSAKFVSDQDIIVERAVYWDAGGVHYAGGHNTMGTTVLGKTWYLAEGYTGGSFVTLGLIQNPTNSVANVTVTFMVQGGDNITKSYSVPANSRYTVNYNRDIGPDKSVSAKFVSDQDIIVERAVYWDAGGVHYAGGHNTMGTTR